jgi:hypothetical protein
MRFVGSLVIEAPAPAIEAALLRMQILGRRLRGGRFQRSMHAFVATILLWFARRDAFVPNAKLDKPRR